MAFISKAAAAANETGLCSAQCLACDNDTRSDGLTQSTCLKWPTV